LHLLGSHSTTWATPSAWIILNDDLNISSYLLFFLFLCFEISIQQISDLPNWSYISLIYFPPFTSLPFILSLHILQGCPDWF
jgi:hypothetical protein